MKEREKPQKSSSQEPAPAAPPATATRTTLRNTRGQELIVTLYGKQVMLGEGAERSVQVLDSEADAKEHFERIVMLRRKSGFTVLRTEACAGESVRPPDILETHDFDGKIDLVDGRWTLTFKGDVDEKISKEVADALVQRIAAAAPRRVQILCDFASPKQAWERALTNVLLPSVESFIFDTFFQTQTRQSANSIGDLAAVLRACPNLRCLFATGALSLSAVTQPSLHTLHLLGDPLSRSVAQGLGGCRFEALERLVLSLCADGGPAQPDAFVDSLRTLAAPRLREIHLGGIDDPAACLTRLLSGGLPPSWKVLSLTGTSRGAFELDALRPVLTRHAAALRSLESLALDLGDEDEVAEAKEILPGVRSAEPEYALTLPTVYEPW